MVGGWIASYVFIFIFWSRCCCCCCVLLLLPTTSELKRREVPPTASSFSVSATTTAVSFASILLPLLRLRRDACRKKTPKSITFFFLVAALLLLFTHREGCAEKNKIYFCFLFDTGTQSTAVSVTRYVLLLFLTAPGSCCRPPCRPAFMCVSCYRYYRDTQHGAMEPWSTSIHKKLSHFPFDEIYRRLLFFTLGRSVSA